MTVLARVAVAAALSRFHSYSVALLEIRDFRSDCGGAVKRGKKEGGSVERRRGRSRRSRRRGKVSGSLRLCRAEYVVTLDDDSSRLVTEDHRRGDLHNEETEGQRRRGGESATEPTLKSPMDPCTR